METEYIDNEIFNVDYPALNDSSIISYEYHTVSPYSSTSLNENDEIRIPIHQADLITLPCESFLIIEGTVTRSDSTEIKTENTKKEALTSNCAAFLFSEMRYEVNGIELDAVRNPGITSLIKGMVSLTPQQITRLTNAGWAPDHFVTKTDGKNFSFSIPLKILMGFFEDFRKVLLNVKQELILIRSKTNINSYIAEGEQDLKVTLSKVLWQVPFIIPNDSVKLALMKKIKTGRMLPIAFRSWNLIEYPTLPSNTKNIEWPLRIMSVKERPRWIIVGFQTKRNEKKEAYSCVFDSCEIRNIKAHVGSISYPYTAFNVDFDSGHFSTLYDAYAKFIRHYYHSSNIQGVVEDPPINTEEFASRFPLWVIDCSHQPETVQGGSVDIRLEIESKKNFPEETSIYCVIINDRSIEYSPFEGQVRILK